MVEYYKRMNKLTNISHTHGGGTNISTHFLQIRVRQTFLFWGKGWSNNFTLKGKRSNNFILMLILFILKVVLCGHQNKGWFTQHFFCLV